MYTVRLSVWWEFFRHGKKTPSQLDALYHRAILHKSRQPCEAFGLATHTQFDVLCCHAHCLQIPADRYYCYFVVQKPVEVGWSGTTFASFM